MRGRKGTRRVNVREDQCVDFGNLKDVGGHGTPAVLREIPLMVFQTECLHRVILANVIDPSLEYRLHTYKYPEGIGAGVVRVDHIQGELGFLST